MRFVKLTDFVVISIVLFVSFVPFLVKNNAGEKKFYLFIEDNRILLPVENGIIDLKKYGKNILIEIKDEKMRFVESDCYDKICIKMGFVADCGDSAVCLPNKTAIQVECGENEFDAISR